MQKFEDLNGALMDTYEFSCLMKVEKSNREVLWWNNHLKELRYTVRRLWNVSKRTGDWISYTVVLTICNTEK